MPSQREIQDWLVSQISELLYIDSKEIGIRDTFTSFGLSSRDAVMLSGDLEEWLNRRFSPTLVYEYTTIESLSEYLSLDVEPEVDDLEDGDELEKEEGELEPESVVEGQIQAGVILERKVETGSRIYPLSYNQRAMWIQHQFAPDSIQNPVYTVRIHSRIDVSIFGRIFNRLVEWHDSLRTTFELHDGQPVQRVHDSFETYFQHQDVSSWSEERLYKHLKDEAGRPFDLERGPLFRVFIFSKSETEHVLMFAAHHIIIDLWSMAVIINEMSMMYPAALNKQVVIEDFPSPHRVEYHDFVNWQKILVSSRKGEKLWKYWQKQLAGDLTPLELPADRPRSAIQTFNGTSSSFFVAEALTKNLKSLAEKYGCSLFHTLLAAFNVLLYRYTGQEDIIVGSPMVGRTRAEFTGIVGYFVNPVPLRTKLRSGLKFSDLMLIERKIVLGAISRHDFPFSAMVERIHPERDPSHTPIFQVMFVYQKTHPTYDDRLSKFALELDGLKMNVAGLDMETVKLEKLTAPFDITLMMAETEDGLGVTLTYNTDLFDESTVIRLWEHYTRLLQEIVLNPERPISQIPILSDNEKNKILVEFNNTQNPLSDNKCVHEIFAEQVKRSPSAKALTFKNQSLTYSELNQKANQLAHHLRSMGVGPDKVVGISVERSMDMVIGLLAILKAGGAYLPIDPVYPVNKLNYMLKDTGALILLTQSSIAERLPEVDCTVLKLDRDWIGQISTIPGISDQLANIVNLNEDPINITYPENLAYVIYTSGSTGQSKGVMLHHKGLLNLVYSQTRGFDVDHTKRVLQFASFSFDASVSEIFMALLTGAELVLAQRDTLLSAPELEKLLIEKEITTITLPPSLLSLLPANNLPSLTTVISAGESCPPEIANNWANGRAFFNAYGPTECTIGPTMYRYENNHQNPSGRKINPYSGSVMKRNSGISTIPIGKPIDNTRIYILDSDMNPVPLGIPGEICISGVGLARGYLGKPELTAQKFVPDPYSPDNGAQLYKTGDLGRFLPDGNVEFIGRTDHQVKVRGFRIELGEIEIVLSGHPAVRQAVVVARGDKLANKKLSAYILPENGVELSIDVLKSQVRKDLPEYMMPSEFMIVDEFPLNTSGKVDRARLPKIETDPRDRESVYVPPQTQLERDIANVWQEILNVEIVGLDDNFFDLGGHSLLLTQAHMRLQDKLKLEFSVVEMFSNPTIRTFAQFLNQTETNFARVEVSFGRADRQREALHRQKERLRSIARERSRITKPDVPTQNTVSDKSTQQEIPSQKHGSSHKNNGKIPPETSEEANIN